LRTTVENEKGFIDVEMEKYNPGLVQYSTLPCTAKTSGFTILTLSKHFLFTSSTDIDKIASNQLNNDKSFVEEEWVTIKKSI